MDSSVQPKVVRQASRSEQHIKEGGQVEQGRRRGTVCLEGRMNDRKYSSQIEMERKHSSQDEMESNDISQIQIEERDICWMTHQSQESIQIGTQQLLQDTLEQNFQLNYSRKEVECSQEVNSRLGNHLMITDVAMHMEDLDDIQYFYGLPQNEDCSWRESVVRRLQNNNVDFYMLLVVLAMLVPCLSVLIDLGASRLLEQLKKLVVSREWTDLGLAVLLCCSTALASVLITMHFQYIEGSGIPETKTVIAGISIYKYMSMQTLCMKATALVLALGSGFFIGKEGPFVHLSACIANNLSKLRVFSRMHHRNTLRRQLLAIAAGVGVTATFGTPVGGCLYSIETVISFIAVNHIWKSFLCCFLTAMSLRFLSAQLGVEVFAHHAYLQQTASFGLGDVLVYLLLGVVVGGVGALFVACLKQTMRARKYLVTKWGMSPVVYSLVVVLAHLAFYRYSTLGMVNEDVKRIMADIGPLQDDYIHLGAVTAGRLVLHLLALSSMIPSGNLIPLFFLGALLGRLFYPVGVLLGCVHPPAAFAVVGAACLVSATTHSIVAITVITFEYTQQIVILFPLLITLVAAYSFATLTHTNLYHLLIEIKNLPLLPRLLRPEQLRLTAKDIMSRRDILHVTPASNMSDLGMIINQAQGHFPPIVVLRSVSSLHLLGTLQLGYVKDYLYHQFSRFKTLPNPQVSNSVFWNSPVDLHHPLLHFNPTPFSVSPHLSLLRLHFIYLMLGLHQSLVIEHGRLVGVVTITDFVK